MLLSGCASQQPAEPDYYARTEYQVSAKNYGLVRPAADVVVMGSGAGYGAYQGGDLWDRMRAGMGLRISHHARVDREIRRLKSNPKYLAQLSQRARPYLHLILREIERRGLPTELALLPEVESRYNPKALSPKAASGMWQFIPPTGKKYGLKQNALYDGRNDILASTKAAFDYLEKLHREFGGSWALALAGYNAGEGRVAAARRANRSRGKPTGYWSLNLPRETEHYVPKLLAVARLVAKPQRYGMRLPPIANGPQLEILNTGRQIDLATAAKMSGVKVADLRRLNPGLKKGKTLPAGPHHLLVPVGSGNGVRVQLARSDVKREAKQEVKKPAPPKGSRTYRVRKGDNLGQIARRHGISVSSLRNANRLKGDRIAIGRHLLIPAKSKGRKRSPITSAANRPQTVMLDAAAPTTGNRTSPTKPANQPIRSNGS